MRKNPKYDSIGLRLDADFGLDRIGNEAAFVRPLVQTLQFLGGRLALTEHHPWTQHRTHHAQLAIGGYPRVQDSTYCRIWIDLNRDKDFEDEGEQIMQTKSVYKGLAKGTVKLPRIFDAGAYVMRISLSKGKFSSACGDNGSTAIETEDYLLQVNPTYRCATPVVQNIRVQNIKYNRAILFAVGIKASKYNWYLERIDGSYAQKYTSLGVDSFQLENLQDDVNYKIRLQIECEQGESRWSDFVFFKTLSKKTDCTTLGKSDISIVQTTVYNAEVQCRESRIQQIEWR